MGAYVDLTGKKFGRLTVVRRGEDSNSKNTRFLCKCECGVSKLILADSLKCGDASSCGCLLLEIITKHGHSKSKTYSSWKAMKARCTNKNTNQYHCYGGRGIAICKRWTKFENFLEDMGICPEGLSLDRIDNNKGYSKSNCRWATRKEQDNNRRISVFLTYKGLRKTLKLWSEHLNIPYDRIHTRYKRGYKTEDILNVGKLTDSNRDA